MKRPYKLAVFTTAQPHHSSKSGYEQVARFVNPDYTLWRTRNNTPPLPKRGLAKLLRTYALSNWYQWDGVEAEGKAWKLDKQHKGQLLAHFLYGDTSLGLLPRFRRWFKGKIVATMHACPSDFDRVLANPRLLRHIDFLILLGRNQCNELLEMGLSEKKMMTVPHGVDLDFYRPSGLDQPENRKFRVLTVGNWRRNFSLYHKVIQALSDHDDIRFDIVTAKHNQTQFNEYPNVSVYDGLSDEELLSFYQQTDCVLLGLEDAVANNVLLESMACAKPVIVENVGAVTDYVDDQSGILIDPNDAAAAVQVIRELRDHPDAGLRIGRMASEHVKRFDWNIVANELQAVYDMIYHAWNR